MARLTKREKIIRYILEQTGIDITEHEITADKSMGGKYYRKDAVLVDGPCWRGSLFYDLLKLARENNSPIKLMSPYYKDAWGNIEYFHRDNSYTRIIWKGDK